MGAAVHNRTVSSKHLDISNKDQLFAADEQRDIALCGRSLAEPGTTRFAKQGAHDPTPTPYFILEDLFSNLEFFDNSHLLDVGCGTGRVLSFFIQSNLPGKATGVELDPDIAACARTWNRRFENVDVLCDNALEMPLDAFSARVSFQSLRHQRAHAVHHESRSGSTTTAHACPYVRQRRNLLLYWKKRLEPSSPGRVSVVPDCNRAVVSRLRLPAALLHLAIRARGIASRQARTPVRGSESSYVDEPAPMACDRSHVFEQLHEKSGIIRDQVEVRLSSVTLHQR